MSTATIAGLSISYEVIGDRGARPWVVIPGGRVSKDGPGIRELALRLAGHGNRVLIWDRPNAGASDVCFTGPTEAAMHADVLAGLLAELEMAPAVVCGGSAGARLSLITAIRHPDVTSAAALWWTSGGVYALMFLGNLYYGASIAAGWNGSMTAVAELPEWHEVTERNPANRQRFLDQDPEEFIATFQRWMRAFTPGADELEMGIDEAQVRRLDLPVLIFRNGVSDMNHTRATSDRLASVLPSARVVDPPWPDTEWVDRRASGEVGFARWPLLAPALHAWADEVLPPAARRAVPPVKQSRQ
jgi:pimeloyl-ACP methyl ester carboxylesterase